MKVGLTVNQIVMTDYLEPFTWFLEEYDGSIIDQLEANILDVNRALIIPEWCDVYLYDKDNPTDILFGGMAAEVQGAADPDSLGRIWSLTCVDWKTILDRSYFSGSYRNILDTDIIESAFSRAGLTEISIGSLVQSSGEMMHLTFKGASLRQMLDQVTQITRHRWDVSKEKELIYMPEGASPRLYHFSDTPTFGQERPYDFSRVFTSSQFNEVEIHGSSRLRNVENQTYSGDGVRTIYTLRVDGTRAGENYPLIIRGKEDSDDDIPEIDSNQGTDAAPAWLALVVSADEDDVAADVYWNAVTHQLTFRSAPNDLTSSWRISGRGIIAASWHQPDLAEQNRVGHRFNKILVVPEVSNDQEAEALAAAFLREQKGSDRVTFLHDVDGVRIGDNILVSNMRLGMDSIRYQVRSQTMRYLGNGLHQYKVNCYMEGT